MTEALPAPPAGCFESLLPLQHLRMGRQEVIAERALLLVTEQVALQHRLAVLRARHHERDGGPVA